MDPSEYFSLNYNAARNKFLDAVEHIDATKSISINASGPSGQKLFTDVCWLGDKNATRVLVLISGTHGVEGACGSGVQVGTLLSYAKALPKGVAILLVHAVNPYGFAWQRRTTEEGIDLNRNFLDFDKDLPKNPLYDQLADALVPCEWSGPIRQNADKRINACIEEIGFADFATQLPLGQHKYGFAPFFGGYKEARANLTLKGIIQKYLNEASDVAILDFHTGLGMYGHGELLCFHSTGSVELIRAQKWWGPRLTSVFSDKCVAYPATGSLVDGLEKMLSHANVTSAIYEFGTVAPMKVLDAMRADHWLHTYGDPKSSVAEKIKQNMFDAFFGDTNEWKAGVWKQSSQTIESAIKNLDAAG